MTRKSIISVESIDNAKFTKAMNKLFDLVREEIGGSEIQESIAGWLWDSKNWDYESKVVPCKYDEDGMYYVTYDICNYDLICLDEKGKVDVKNSNHPDIAKCIAPYLSAANGQRIVENLYGWA